MENGNVADAVQADRAELAERVRRMRHEAGLSQRALAARAGCSAGAISGIEGGRSSISLTLAKRLAGVFHVTIDDLAGGTQ